MLAKYPANNPGGRKAISSEWPTACRSRRSRRGPKNRSACSRTSSKPGVIRQLVQGVPETPANTSWYFSGISQAYQAGVLAEIEKHYGVKLKVESVVVPPGRLPITSILNDGKVDFVTQLNATGGNSQEMRRRTSRRFSCTMTASSQFIHIPEESELAERDQQPE